MENAQPEQSMEEILASIRRIISEDEEGGETPKAPAAAKPEATRPEAVEPPVSEPEPSRAEAAEPPAAPTAQEAEAPDFSTPSEPAAAADEHPIPADAGAAAPLDMPSQTEGLEMLKKNVEAGVAENQEALILDQTAAAAASQAFESLSQSVRVADKDSRTLEDIVVAMLKPMIKDWLDANLPAIVEEKVEQEVQRVSRRRG